MTFTSISDSTPVDDDRFRHEPRNEPPSHRITPGTESDSISLEQHSFVAHPSARIPPHLGSKAGDRAISVGSDGRMSEQDEAAAEELEAQGYTKRFVSGGREDHSYWIYSPPQSASGN